MGTMIALLQPATMCDIGPGAGKYGRIAKAQAREHDFACRTTALEIDASYVEEFDLRAIYDEVVIADAISLLDNPRLRFDLVVIGDCIEHMRKSTGVDLLNFLIYRTGYIAVLTPREFVQDDWEGHAAEAHISTWSAEDFAGWDTLHKTATTMGTVVDLYLVKGLQPTRMRITG
jgi:hypothetical protein